MTTAIDYIRVSTNEQADLVIVSKLDRLTRSIGDLANLLRQLKSARRADGETGVDLIACDESLNTRTAAGLLTINFMASVSQWERKIIAELRGQGQSLQIVADTLTREGRRTRGGREFSR